MARVEVTHSDLQETMKHEPVPKLVYLNYIRHIQCLKSSRFTTVLVVF